MLRFASSLTPRHPFFSSSSLSSSLPYSSASYSHSLSSITTTEIFSRKQLFSTTQRSLHTRSPFFGLPSLYSSLPPRTLRLLPFLAMASCAFSSSAPTPVGVKTFVPPPLPHPRHPTRFTSSLPCDELSALGQEDGEEAVPVPDNLLSTPRMVRNAVYSFVNPEDQSKNAFLLSWNKEFAKELGVNINKIEQTQWSEQELDQLVKVLTGGGRKIPTPQLDEQEADKGPRETLPWAHCYGGHQFGYYAGQLGDGRAISLCKSSSPSLHVLLWQHD